MSTTSAYHARGITDVSTFKPDRLIAGDTEFLKSEKATISVPANTTYRRGALLGRQYVATAADPPDSNTGNGTLAAIGVGRFTRLGRYLVRFASATGYNIFDPYGYSIFQGGTAGTAIASTHDIVPGWNPTAGATAFAAGDELFGDIGAGTVWSPAVITATNSTHKPAGILAIEAVNDTESAITVSTEVFTHGIFNGNAVFAQTPAGSGYTLDSVRVPLGRQGIYLLNSDVFVHDPLDTAAIL